ncbi:tandem-95 repeat protein, partial [Marinomonas epiphytica]
LVSGQGSVSVVANEIVYTPASDFNGQAEISYTVSDGNGGSDTATVTVNVSPINDAPNAGNINVYGSLNTQLSIDVLAHSNDVEGDSIIVSEATLLSGSGLVSVVANEVVFAPSTNFTGYANIEYTLNDGNGGTDTGSITVAINTTNIPPVAADLTVDVDEGSSIVVDVVASASDLDIGDTLTVTSPVIASGQGSVEIDSNQVVFTPADNFNGEAQINYTVSDGNGGSDTGTITVRVNPVNEAPIANDTTGAGDEDTSITLDVVASATDADGDTLTVSNPVLDS